MTNTATQMIAIIQGLTTHLITATVALVNDSTLELLSASIAGFITRMTALQKSAALSGTDKSRSGGAAATLCFDNMFAGSHLLVHKLFADVVLVKMFWKCWMEVLGMTAGQSNCDTVSHDGEKRNGSPA